VTHGQPFSQPFSVFGAVAATESLGEIGVASDDGVDKLFMGAEQRARVDVEVLGHRHEQSGLRMDDLVCGSQALMPCEFDDEFVQLKVGTSKTRAITSSGRFSHGVQGEFQA
jgi:hypothetical protein